MRSSVFILVLAVVSLKEIPLQCNGAQSPFQPSLKLLYKSVDALSRALSFMGSQLKGLNLDGVIGPRIASDQFELLVERYEKRLSNGSTDHPLLSLIKRLQNLADSVALTSLGYVHQSDPNYFYVLADILKKGFWKLDYPVRTLSSLKSTARYSSPTKVMVELFEMVTDTCNSFWLGTSNYSRKPCEMDKSCWVFMTSDGFVEYALTHEIFFLEIGEAAGCFNQMTNLANRYNGVNVSQLQDTFCSRIYHEASNIEANGFMPTQQDLFMEQIALCGLLGYREFLKTDWIESILRWQSENGCFTRGEFLNTVGTKGKTTLVKRSDVPLIDGCSSHKTSVAIGAIAISIRFLFEGYMDGVTYY